MAQQFRIFFLLALVLSLAACNEKEIGKPAHLRTVQGQVIDFPSHKNQWVVLNFWASWCAPCREEISELNLLNKHENLVVVGVNVENLSRESLSNLVQNFKINYPVLLSDPHALFDLPPYPGIPATFILSPDGKWMAPLYGKQSKQSILDAISRT